MPNRLLCLYPRPRATTGLLTLTARGGQQAFFDAAVTLVFFLLIGRYLDRLMRERARSAVSGLARLAARGAVLLHPDGEQEYLPLQEIRPGMVLRIAAGERLPVDAEVLRGASDLDRALVTGESAPVSAGPGDVLEAGTLNLTGALDARVLRASYLAEMMRLLEAAEHGRGAYVRLADRAARPRRHSWRCRHGHPPPVDHGDHSDGPRGR